MLIFHGSQIQVTEPEIRITRFTKDFSWGFYCTLYREQAEKWAVRHRTEGYVNIFEYVEVPELKIKRFEEVNEEWKSFLC